MIVGEAPGLGTILGIIVPVLGGAIVGLVASLKDQMRVISIWRQKNAALEAVIERQHEALRQSEQNVEQLRVHLVVGREHGNRAR